ncbi:hypothetical protein ACFQS7_25420 [Dankookia sp. GCM10030260]
MLAAVLDRSPVPPALEMQRDGHVGAAACAGCHQAQHLAWLGSHHRHGMAVADNASVQAPFASETATHSGRESQFFAATAVSWCWRRARMAGRRNSW